MSDDNAIYVHLGMGETGEASAPFVRKMLELQSALRRLHAAAKIVTATEWPQDASPMGAMDEFDQAMAEAEKILNPGQKGESSQVQQ